MELTSIFFVLEWSEERSKWPKSIVDVGCGIGGSSRYLAKKFGATSVGITLSPVQAQRANALAAAQGLDDKVFFFSTCFSFLVLVFRNFFITNYKMFSINLCFLRKKINLINHIKPILHLIVLSFYFFSYICINLIVFLLIFGEKIIK